MIPKIIHYCWFGGNPLPELAIKCIESWKKYCPQYEIKEWNELNFDINACEYVKQAYAAQKWAFVSDYARFWILYHEGGLYFDTDVELIRSIDDLVEKGSFMGCEPAFKSNEINSNPGLGLAAAPGLGLYKAILDFYESRSFYRENGALDLTTVVENTTSILEARGWRREPNIQCIGGMYIYPPDFFCPMNYYSGEMVITENTRSIHHYSESWLSERNQRVNHTMRVLIQRFGEKNGYRIWCIYAFPYRLKRKIKRVGWKGMIEYVAANVLKNRK